MTKIKRKLYIYFRFLSINVKMMLEYKSDFMVMMISGVLTEVLGLIFIWSLYQYIPSIGGWNMWDVIFLYAMIYLTSGIISIFFEGTWSLSFIVNRGDLDRILLRPISPIIQVFTLGIGANGLSNFVLGLIMLYQALIHMDIIWTVPKILFFLILIISSIIIRASVNLAAAASSFWMNSGSNSISMMTLNISEFVKYPITIFGWGIKLIVTLIIPYAFITYYPAIFLLDKPHWRLALLSPLVAIYCVLVSILIFKAGLRKYESAGN